MYRFFILIFLTLVLSSCSLNINKVKLEKRSPNDDDSIFAVIGYEELTNSFSTDRKVIQDLDVTFEDNEDTDESATEIDSNVHTENHGFSIRNIRSSDKSQNGHGKKKGKQGGEGEFFIW